MQFCTESITLLRKV